MFRQLFKYSLLMAVLALTENAWSGTQCDPVVEGITAESTVATALAGLAEKYNFSLSFPKSQDHRVEGHERMLLSKMIKSLTADMSTIVRYEKAGGCAGSRLAELIVVPSGEESEFISVERKTRALPDAYIYIDDMEQYVTDVLMKRRKARPGKMTPEQRMEFKLTKKRLKKELKDEIRQNNKRLNKKSSKKKARKKQEK